MDNFIFKYVEKMWNNTNVAEATYALINREEKQLKLMLAILW
jgi:hypothetical protein